MSAVDGMYDGKREVGLTALRSGLDTFGNASTSAGFCTESQMGVWQVCCSRVSRFRRGIREYSEAIIVDALVGRWVALMSRPQGSREAS